MQKRVGILRGGMGENYGDSLKKGGEILAHISENLSDNWKASDVLLDKDGVWHINGVPIEPADLLHRVDIVWSTVNPSISTTLNNLSIPFIGQNLFHSTLDESKEMLAKHIKKIGLDIPRSVVIPVYQEDFDGLREQYAIKKAKEVHAKFGAPWIVRSFTEDKNMGIHLAKTFPELVDSIEDGVKHNKSILVEEFISGKIASVHSVPMFRGEDIYTFPLGTTFGIFSVEEKDKLINFAKRLCNHLGVTHYLKSDFVLNPRGKVYLLQTESIPNLKPDSHFAEVCESIGTKPHHVIKHILEQTLV